MSKLFSSSDRLEVKQEALLRATLSEYAPANVDLEKGCTAVAERLAAMCQQTQPLEKPGLRFLFRNTIYNLPFLSRNAAHGLPWWRSFYTLVAMATFVFLLLGASCMSSYFFWNNSGDPFSIQQQIEDQHLFSNIGQRQQIGPVAITITKAYADKELTLIVYDMQLSTSMVGRYSSINIIAQSLTDPAGEGAMRETRECTVLSRDGGPIHCVMLLTSFHPAAKASQLALSWTITRISLVPLSRPANVEILIGYRKLRFTVPFHSGN